MRASPEPGFLPTWCPFQNPGINSSGPPAYSPGSTQIGLAANSPASHISSPACRPSGWVDRHSRSSYVVSAACGRRFTTLNPASISSLLHLRATAYYAQSFLPTTNFSTCSDPQSLILTTRLSTRSHLQSFLLTTNRSTLNRSQIRLFRPDPPPRNSLCLNLPGIRRSRLSLPRSSLPLVICSNLCLAPIREKANQRGTGRIRTGKLRSRHLRTKFRRLVLTQIDIRRASPPR
jgi:hypothetical protein